MARSINFIHSDLNATDCDLFFGAEPVLSFEADSLAPLLVEGGIFPSLKQARNNGWDRPLRPGFQEFRVGKNTITVLNIWEGHDV